MTFMAIKSLFAIFLLLQPSPQCKVFHEWQQHALEHFSSFSSSSTLPLPLPFVNSNSTSPSSKSQWPLSSAINYSMGHPNEWPDQEQQQQQQQMLLPLQRQPFTTTTTTTIGISMVTARPPRPTVTLFAPFDGVNSLNSDNFTSIYGRSNCFLMLFYATWCGHCKAFAPSYRSLAMDIAAWKSVVQVSAVNCADPYNTKLCREQEVMAYPSLKFFPPFSPYNDKGYEFIIATTTIDSMRSTLIHAIMEYIRSTVAPTSSAVAPSNPTNGYPTHSYPSHWPDLLPVNASTLSELIYRVTFHRKVSPQLDHRPIVLIVEPFNSDVGCEVILDLSGYQRYIKIYRVIYNLANPVINELISSLGLNTITVPLPLVMQVVSNNSNVHHSDHFPVNAASNSANGNSNTNRHFTVSGSGYKLLLLMNSTSSSSTTTTTSDTGARSYILRQLVSQFLPDTWIDLKAQLNETQQQQLNAIISSGATSNNNLNVNGNSNSNNLTSPSGASHSHPPNAHSNGPNFNSINQEEDDDELSPYPAGVGGKTSSSLSSTPTSISPSESIDSEVDSTDSVLIDSQTSSQIHIVDLNNALRYSLYQEILLHSKVGEDEMSIIKSYFNLINRFYPFTNENIRRFVRRMSQWSNLRNTSSADSFQAIMKAGSEGFLPPFQNYVTCRGSKKEFRGYPCAFWLIFHTLTVSEYKSMRRRNVTVHEVLPLMKSYVKSFFTCKSCSQHFDSLTSNLTSKLIYQNSSVLLLWQIHNIVNEKTAGSASEDPYFPKLPYPTVNDCPKCQFVRSKRQQQQSTGDSINNNKNGAEKYDWNVSWNLDEVFTFLITRYDRANIIRKTFPGRSSSSSWSSLTCNSLSQLILLLSTITFQFIPLLMAKY